MDLESVNAPFFGITSRDFHDFLGRSLGEFWEIFGTIIKYDEYCKKRKKHYLRYFRGLEDSSLHSPH